MPKWNLDPAHTAAAFSARHMMITTVRGGFRNITGTLDYNPDNLAAAKVEAVIETTTLTSTGIQQRDDHLRSADFLDIANYPTITFKSTKVEPAGDGTHGKMTGDLTIRGVTRPVTLDVEFIGQTKDPWGGTRIGFSGTTRINRDDWGLNWNMALEAGGWLVSKDVTLNVDVEAVLVEEPAAV